MAKILAFPGVDLAALVPTIDPRRQTLSLREGPRGFVLAEEPSGRFIPRRFASATAARSYAGELCHAFPRLYRRVIDETRSTRQSVGEIMAGAPFEGDAA